MKLSATLFLTGAFVAAALASTPAMAFKAHATVKLNIRTGPGEQFPIAGEMKWESHGEVDSCTPDYAWCHITTANGVGRAAGEYLTEKTLGRTILQLGAESGIPVVVPTEIEIVQ